MIERGLDRVFVVDDDGVRWHVFDAMSRAPADDVLQRQFDESRSMRFKAH